MQEIKHIGVFQAAKFMAVMYLLVSAVIVIPLTFILMAFGSSSNPFGLLVLLLPVLYGIVGFIFTAIGCWVYNLVASMVGGIEIELEVKQ
ncbi:MAG: hypothetical protein ABSH05_15910 [Bryobacteraceae bacterium]|jgi:hypothetical protein